MTKAEPNVAIVLLNWNGKDLLTPCLDSLKKTTYANYRVLVVDNGSQDGSVELILDGYKEVELLALPANLGFSKGCNQGIKHILKTQPSDYILLLNNDIEITHGDWLRKLVSTAERDAEIGIVGCKLLRSDGGIQSMGCLFKTYDYANTVDIPGWQEPPHVFEVDSIIGAVFLIKKKTLDTIGLLDEGFSPYGGEDHDYCARAKFSGFKIVIDPAVTVFHKSRASASKLPNRQFYRILWKNTLRNRWLNAPFSGIAIGWTQEIRNAAAGIFERKNKEIGYNLTNLKFRRNWRENFTAILDAYFTNLRNAAEILNKRSHRSQKLWF